MCVRLSKMLFIMFSVARKDICLGSKYALNRPTVSLTLCFWFLSLLYEEFAPKIVH